MSSFLPFFRAYRLSISIILAACLIAGTFVYKADALTGLPFGGLVVATTYCTCTNAFLLTISTPTPGNYLYFPGTPQFSYYQLPRVGVWTLGLYAPGGACLMFAGKAGCVPYALQPSGTIEFAGTSL